MFELSHALTRYFFIVRDRFTKDDAIGTIFLDLNKMSSFGGEVEGNAIYSFLPFLCVYRYMTNLLMKITITSVFSRLKQQQCF